MLSPLQRYEKELAAGTLLEDPAQAEAIGQLDELHSRLCARLARERGLSARVARWMGRPRVPEQGLYLWGGVGRGKTHLMDIFFDALPFERKLRVHFHRFMQRVHNALTEHGGAKNPLEQVAEDIADDAMVLCFDEFFVSDIGDAMILAGLIDALFRRGVTLVATSNIPPADLYRDGLQRSRFLPAIALLESHLQVTHLDSTTDYRFRTLSRADLWHVPHEDSARASLEEYFTSLTGRPVGDAVVIEVNQRQLPLIAGATGVAWFDFGTLCEDARSASDYVEIAREYHTVLIENIPAIGKDREDAARRFVNLVDEFYDRNVKLIATAAEPPESLYVGTRLAFEFERTVSRLQEMRTQEYLQAEHHP
ncbi:MAG: cell division protein ZapE [Luminiphilus sp.]